MSHLAPLAGLLALGGGGVSTGAGATAAIGWASSLVLVLTLGKQVYKQWTEGSSKGVSRWLFLGQMAASTGFTVYSALVRNWVFVVTNALMIGNGLAGYLIVRLHRRRERRRQARREPARAPIATTAPEPA